MPATKAGAQVALQPRAHGGHRDHGEHGHSHDHSHGHAHAGSQDKDHEPRPARGPALGAGDGSGKLLFLDAFSGLAGDMLVAGLADLGVPEEVFRQSVEPLPLEGFRLQFSGCMRSSIAATHFNVEVDSGQKQRDYAEIRKLLAGAGHLTEGTRERAQAAFALLAQAEANVHNTSVDDVHFHEVGAVDSIVDIVAACAGFDYLGARVVASPLPMGRGFIQSQHGRIPAPAPATVACLAGVPTYSAGIDSELVTPTGACLVRVLCSEFANWPNMAPERIGWGAGTRKLPDRPNLLRMVLGVACAPAPSASGAGTHVVLETNLDDVTGEIVGHAMDQAFAAGALDVWTVPIGMKKGRPALMLCALARKLEADQVGRALLSESTSLGLRLREVDRIERKRRLSKVTTAFGEIQVKIADGDGLAPNVAPEFESCKAAAQAYGVPLKSVFSAAIAAFEAQNEI